MNYVKREQKIISDDGFLQRIHETVHVGLKKCPKCGSSAKTVRLDLDDIPEEFRADFADKGGDFYIIQCSKCKYRTDFSLTIEEAAAQWNEEK